jgi:hypothetical protein
MYRENVPRKCAEKNAAQLEEHSNTYGVSLTCCHTMPEMPTTVNTERIGLFL